MPIRFTCSNPTCGHKMRAEDNLAGKRVRCPRCRAIQTVPAERAPQTSPARGAGGAILCPDCGTTFPARALLCPRCGWVNSSLQPPLPAGPLPPGAAPPAASIGPLAADCLKAIAYGLSNFRSIVVLVLCFLVVYLVVHFLLNIFSVFLWFTGLGNFIMVVLGGAVQVGVGGYFLRYYLDVVISSLEGDDQAPNLPDFRISELFATGVKGLGLLVVYVTPIVTLPLLPLGLLAAGYSDDNRCLHVPWALRAAGKRPRRLAVLWAFILLWLALGFAGTYGIMLGSGVVAVAVAARGGGAPLLAFLIVLGGVILAAAIDVMFTCVLFRCISMLGRHDPALLEMLPESDRPSVTAGVVLAGIAVSAVLWYFGLPAVLRALAA